MALTKVTKHIVYGSTLISYFGHDLTDFTHASATWAAWGESATYTPCLLYTSPSPRDATLSRMPSSA